MNLIPDPSQPAQPGLWINTDWQPGTPGAFAVIIGVSHYDHLVGKKTYGLGQLHVSALTGYYFFRWLLNDFRCSGITLAKCWLLLSASPAERPLFEPDVGNHLHAPTMQNCEDSIGAWYEAMKQLDKGSAIKSRSFLFLSGHGIQFTEEKQIQLPQ
jgi:hypothetical protein